ncbi:uncharacterized protein LOC108654400 isoform X2 [Drosophila navojoa]|uniref:uncharacterized protein LOC108654400 isoform X2 n=1 Tax=Drosophila navojoa TaxID=7232 RepID=UPI0008467845|nr:uncharacterized protein LOC108654400 isoform X2 [Drosophila navojoa]
MAHRIKLRADDFDVVGAVPRDLSVIKNFLKRDCAVKRLIEIEESFLKKCMEMQAEEAEEAKAKKSQYGAIKEEIEQPPPDPCTSTSPPDANAADYCDPCRRLKTSIVLEEVTKPTNINPAMGFAPYFDEETVLDKSQPIKFRFRRRPNSCDTEIRSILPCETTQNTNVMVLTNSNDMMVWPSQKVAQMNRVPVTLLSGPGDLTEYMLEEETIM